MQPCSSQLGHFSKFKVNTISILMFWLVPKQYQLLIKAQIQKFGFIQNKNLPVWVKVHHGLESLAHESLGRSHHTVPSKKKKRFQLVRCRKLKNFLAAV